MLENDNSEFFGAISKEALSISMMKKGDYIVIFFHDNIIPIIIYRKK